MRTTSQLLLAADAIRPRTLQREIGMSDLGSCRRRVGYKLAGTDPVNAVGSVQAAIGTSVHDALARILAEVSEPGDLVEHEVEFAGIKGHLDRWESSTGTVVDTKTTSSRWLEHIRLHDPDHNHIWQIHGYGAALIQAGYPVKRVRLEYLARDTGEEWLWDKPFDPRHVRDALNWLRVVRDSDLDMLPREFEPDSPQCRSCPFGGPDGGICWEGHIPGKDLRTVLYVEHPNAGDWAETLWIARQEGREAKATAERAGKALTAVVEADGRTYQCGDHFLRIDSKGALRFVSGPRESELTE